MGGKGLIAIVLAMLVSGAAAAPPDGPAAPVLVALDANNPQLALSLSDTALRQDALDAQTRAGLLLYRGLANALLGLHEPAMRDLGDAIDSQALPADEREQAYLQRGFLREGLGQLDDAVADYDAAIGLGGYSTAIAFINRGNIHLRRGQLMDAQHDYLAALAADGGQSQYAYYGLGRIAEMESDRQVARGFYAKAVGIDAGYTVARERLSALGEISDVIVSDPAQRIALRPPPGREDSLASLPAVPPLLHLAPMLALRPALDSTGERIWPGDEVQLGAWRSAAEAYAAWGDAKSRAGGILDSASPQVLAADIPGKGHYFRLRIRTGENGVKLCARLAAKALDCFAVRN
jgi:tetratricopeptide (TPR) repeat protein